MPIAGHRFIHERSVISKELYRGWSIGNVQVGLPEGKRKQSDYFMTMLKMSTTIYM